MKKWMLRLLVGMAILILSVIISKLLDWSWVNGWFKFTETYFPLLAALGVIISALMATTSSALTIENTNKEKKVDLDKQEKIEITYMLSHLKRMEATLQEILNFITINENKITLDYIQSTDSFTKLEYEKLEIISKNLNDLVKKIDSKFFYYIISENNRELLIKIIEGIRVFSFKKDDDSLSEIIQRKDEIANLISIVKTLVSSLQTKENGDRLD